MRRYGVAPYRVDKKSLRTTQQNNATCAFMVVKKRCRATSSPRINKSIAAADIQAIKLDQIWTSGLFLCHVIEKLRAPWPSLYQSVVQGKRILKMLFLSKLAYQFFAKSAELGIFYRTFPERYTRKNLCNICPTH